jgi:hypothetical protein
MLLRRILLLAALFALLVPATARAAGGNYVFDGGTPQQQAEVVAALDASVFDWSIVPVRVTIHITPGAAMEATPGGIWVDPSLLVAGRFAWGPIQHEYAHQVDFFLLDDVQRQALMATLGGATWWGGATVPHGNRAAERFASTVAWAYWQSKDNSLRPTSRRDEAGAVRPLVLRALLARVLGATVRR